MQMSVLVSEFGPQKVKCPTCPTCAQPMRLVGIEAYPEIPEMVDLVTYECACGSVVAEPHLAKQAIGALAS